MKNLKTIDGETLMSKPLQPLSFVVGTLISQGLHILTGSPKAGKSWLALRLAETVIIIDTLQMIRGTTYDNTYANDYRDLSALKRLAVLTESPSC